MKIKRSCKYLGPCPRCGSSQTAFYVYIPLVQMTAKPYYIRMHMKHGELVRVETGIAIRGQTDRCVCNDCGIEWNQYIPTIYVTSDELEKIKEEKEITEDKILNMKKFNKRYSEKQKEQLKEKKRKEKINKKERKYKLW